MIRKLTSFFIIAFTLSSFSIQAQLTVNGSQFFIESGAVVTVQGDITGTTDILGPGEVLLQGTSNQNINMNGNTIPMLEVDNSANVTLTGNTRIGSSLIFTNGKINSANFNFTLADVATTTGMGTNKFIETTGAGQVFKELTSNISAIEIPVGAGTNYRPAFITTNGTYNSTAKVGIRVAGVSDPNKPPKLSDYISAYWPVTKTGVTGTVTVAGKYINVSDVTGTEANLRGYYFNGTDWSSTGETHNTTTDQISAPITAATGELSALDKFDLLNAKVFLQGAYNTTTGLMSDALRTPTNLIPLSDPYRTAPYSASFTHVANAGIETANASVFNNQAAANDNIVDWVFVELRNTTVSPGNTVLQTRSALVQRDGDIVDVDGVSPVTFNNVASANYVIAVRHRNHLGLSTDPSTYKPALGETKSTASLVDLTTQSDPNLYGPATAYTIVGGKNLLWGGNANFNNNVKFTGPSNDKDYILSVLLGGVGTGALNGYNQGDLNFNRVVKYTGPANDKDFLLSIILNGVGTSTKTEALPQ
ncbi:MAG: hypothetical protein M3015_10380 [Bacteroidota bacterium]|nr:hypothetical protein [Bacteroidota bacterium]